MVLKRGWLAAIGVASLAGLAWSGAAAAQQYRADELLHLDLSRAVLSPTPLGPAASFAPGPLDVAINRDNNAEQAKAEPVAELKSMSKSMSEAEFRDLTTAAVESKPTTGAALKTAASSLRAAHAPRALVALHRRNPIEAQAKETRIQVWPCKSGGICGWKR